MDRIMVLEDSMINQIAAGEVVERPGSVVKELVENAIDSGATRIIIEIKDGGIGMVRITDNGRGIGEDDVLSAFMRHATSKIRNMDDLENVLTLGFRGEALSSIASVSQVEMVTKPKDQLMAKRVELHGGKLVGESMIGAADGTTVIVRNLFYNTPARRKFLKRPGTESAHVSDIVNRIILGHPEVAFKYIVNNSEIITTNGNGDLKTAILAVYGREVAKGLIEIHQDLDGVTITGFIGRPEIGRGNRSYGNIFINGRYIRSKIIEQAVEESYKTKLMTGKFPVYILNIEVLPNLVDVNVHPQKMEVRFSNEGIIYDAFYSAVSGGLKGEPLIPEVTAPRENPFEDKAYKVDGDPPAGLYDLAYNTPVQEFPKQSPAYAVNMDNVISSLFSKDDGGQSLVKEPGRDYAQSSPTTEVDLPNPLEKPSQNPPFFNNYQIIGQFFGTYWMVEQDSCVYLIDQHAAHERVIFETLVDGYKEKDTVSQQLVEPVIFNLSELETEILETNLPLFKGFGYEIEVFGKGEYAVKSVPFLIRGATSISFFMEILDRLKENENSRMDIVDESINAIAMISCKAAVKGNDRLYYAEAKALIEALLKLEHPFTCPHGRPTIVKLTKYEIEKMFKRIP